jgi:putative methionine-R-sulfoxide reductase with GAF domain
MSQQELSPAEAKYARNATIISGVTAVALLAIVIIRSLSTIQIVGPAITLFITLIAFVSALLSYRGRYIQGTRLLMGVLMTGIVFMALFLEGQGTGGIAIGVIGFMIGSTVALLTRPQQQAARWIIVFVVVAIFAILYDLLGPPGLFEVANLQGLNYITAVMVLLYGIFILFQFPNFNLRAKLITATALVAIVSIVAVTTIVGITTRNALVNQVGNNLNSLAESQAAGIGELITRQVNVLETLALNRAVADAVEARNVFYEGKTPEEIQVSILQLSEEWRTAEATDPLVLSVMNNSTSQEMGRFRQTFPDHIRLLLADRNGAVVAASERPTQFDFSNEEWWIDGYGVGLGSVYVSEPYVDSDLNTVLIDIAVPVRTQNSAGRSQLSGVLLTSFDLSRVLNSALASAQLGEATHFDLHFDNFRQMELGEGTTNVLEFVPSQESQIVRRLQLSGLPFVVGDFHDEASFVSLGQVNTQANEPSINQLEWQVVLTQLEEVALQPVQEQQRINIVLGVVIVVVASITAAVIAQLLARPIVRLSNTAVQVAEGDLSARAPVESDDEIGTLSANFNRMTSQLQESIEGLEQRVAERTRALSASVEVSRSLSTILNLDQLVIEVVEQVRSAFGYYYVQIYLFDESHTTLQMVGGTGEAGQVLLTRGHTLAAGQGLVGQAAATNTPVFIPDVSQAAGWKSNPLLPDTKAEISVPIAVGEQVAGVLDVQHDVTGSLTEEDVHLLQSVAFQVAIAIQNARSYDAARKRAEREATINAINQKIQNATSVDAVLQIATAELGRALNKHKASVQLHNPVHGGNGERRRGDTAASGRTSQGRN